MFRHAGFDNGEHWLLVNSPIFKRRYTVDCDIVMGCTIGCRFCYYRWVAGAESYFGTGQLKELCSPEKLAEVLEKSRLVRKDRDGIMLCARSDGSIQVDRIATFLQAFRHRNPIFVLHRGYFGPYQVDAFGEDERVIFSTTLTPCGKDFGWTPVDEFRQIEGITYLVHSGILPRRISVEVGPINERNVSRATELLQRLEDLGLEFATYRGVSTGTFRLPPSEKELQKIGFLTTQKPNAPAGHAYYQIKNALSEEVEEKLRSAVRRMRLHRFTGTLYKELGIDIAYNRNNCWRKDLGQFGKADPQGIASYVEQLGLPVESVEETPEGYLVHLAEGTFATEDIAMTVGAEFNTSVLFDRYRIAPTLDDLEIYERNSLMAF